jgi:hypothetical protein
LMFGRPRAVRPSRTLRTRSRRDSVAASASLQLSTRRALRHASLSFAPATRKMLVGTAFLSLLALAAARTVVLSNTALPVDAAGDLLLTGELSVVAAANDSSLFYVYLNVRPSSALPER